MRQIEVSTDVFALIWAARRPGEDSEDTILRRLLLSAAAHGIEQSGTVPATNPAGFRDPRYNVHFAEGFEIFRTYKGQRFSAKARGGKWVMEDGKKFSSLNQLSHEVTGRPENAWVNWNYSDSDGKTHRIAELRDKNKIPQRNSANPSTWRDDVVAALRGLGEAGTLYEIYIQVRRIREKKGIPLPQNADAIIRRTLEENSSDSTSFTGRFDLFRSVDGIGSGKWALRETAAKSPS